MPRYISTLLPARNRIENRATEAIAIANSGSRMANYSTNNLNQYTEISSAEPNQQTATPSNQLSAFQLSYDDDGNATLIQASTGTWSVEYNGENRPVRWTNAATGTVITMAFDSQGRRVEYKSVTNGTQNTWLRFLYDGYLCVQVLYSDSPYNVYKEFVWDPTEPVATRPLVFRYAPNSLNLFYAFDGNKNVSDVFYKLTSNGDIAARYDYAPFGAVSAGTPSGTTVPANPLQWSSEVYDTELDLVYYNYRHYSPALGRFLSRDPIQEQGGWNLYAFARNEDVNLSDWRGLEVYAILDTASGILSISDNDTGKEVKANANTGGWYDESGNWFPGDKLSKLEIPAPPGKYIIVSEPGDKHEKDNPKDVWFGLFKDDGNLDDKFYDMNRCKKRDGIRLHKGRLSHGCITIFEGQEKIWDEIVTLIRNTKQGKPIRYGFCCRNKVLRYGSLIIVGNNSSSQNPPSSGERRLPKKEKKKSK